MTATTTTKTASKAIEVPARIATFGGHTQIVVRKGTVFVSFYTLNTDSEKWMTAEHRTEHAAQRGSWQSSEMKAIWNYAGYAPVTAEKPAPKVPAQPSKASKIQTEPLVGYLRSNVDDVKADWTRSIPGVHSADSRCSQKFTGETRNRHWLEQEFAANKILGEAGKARTFWFHSCIVTKVEPVAAEVVEIDLSKVEETVEVATKPAAKPRAARKAAAPKLEALAPAPAPKGVNKPVPLRTARKARAEKLAAEIVAEVEAKIVENAK